MKTKYKTVWISDVHLGSKAANVDFLNNFLKSFDCETLYLVGDFIDGWQLKRNFSYFPQTHMNVIKNILSKAKEGTKVKYIIGNHDELLRSYLDFFEGKDFGNISLMNDDVYQTKDGKHLWVVHGDLYDSVIRNYKWVSHVGDVGYEILLKINKLYNFFRRKLGLNYWSFSSYIKFKVKKAVKFIFAFEETLVKECKKRECDGVITGHIHCPTIKEIDGITYFNDGDWCENNTALIEDYDGNFFIQEWHRSNEDRGYTKMIEQYRFSND
jgi:UDP-2,3-diacylglucosamine pyrophosphatase LpxH